MGPPKVETRLSSRQWAEPVKYDDAAWHYGGDFPADLPPAAGATHIGLFAVWMQLNGHGSALHADGLEVLRRRAVNPAVWFLQNCDEKLTDADLSEEGNRFAERYYLQDITCTTRSASRKGSPLIWWIIWAAFRMPMAPIRLRTIGTAMTGWRRY